MRISILLAAVAVFGACGPSPHAQEPVAVESVADAAVPPADAALGPLTDAAPVSTASDLVARVQAFYAGNNHMTAKFRQELYNPAFGRRTTTDGKMWIARPNRLRWDYYSTKKTGTKKTTVVTRSHISNGSYLYEVVHATKQVFTQNLANSLLPVAVAFLDDTVDLGADFVATVASSTGYGRDDDLVVELTPNLRSPQYQTLYFVIDPAEYRVKQSVIIDAAGNELRTRIYEPDFDKPVANKWFLFSARSVPDYQIVP
jgi:outer membrane lipoprotein-sorting protein